MKIVIFTGVLLVALLGCKLDRDTSGNTVDPNATDSIFLELKIIADSFLTNPDIFPENPVRVFKEYNDEVKDPIYSHNVNINGNEIRFERFDELELNGNTIRWILINNKKTIIKSSSTSSNMDINKMDLYFDYNDSDFFYSEKNNVLITVSDGMRWTGRMNSFDFIQVIDIKNNIAYEFITDRLDL